MEMQTLEKNLDSLITYAPEVVNENANKDSRTFNTFRDLTAGIVAKSYALKKMLPKHIADAHQSGDIHFHDLDYHPFQAMTNCCLIDIEGMLSKGFQMGNAKVTSPKSVQTAAAQIVQIIANVSSSQYGGVTVDRFDETLGKYARLNEEKHRKIAEDFVLPEKLEQYVGERVEKDIKDAVQSFEYEINTLYTSNGQTPFVTIGFGLGTDTYSRMVQKAVLNTRIEGLGVEKFTAIFPKLVFALKKGVNLSPEDINYDIKQLALECSSKRMYPDVLNHDKIVELLGDFKTPMGCRSFLPQWTDPMSGESVNEGRANLGVVTLNLPRISLESEGMKDVFWETFHQKMELMHDALAFRLKRLEDVVSENGPILYKSGAFGKTLGAGENVMSLFKGRRCTLSMGYIGLYETAAAFYGPEWETNPEAKAFTLEILEEMKKYQLEWTERHDVFFSIYATPSESLTDRFCRLDFERFGEIKDITDKGYYMNSFHYDVRKDVTPFEKIDFEQDYPHLAGGGFIHYCEYPKMTHNLKALEAVWDYAYDKVGYLGTNTPIDRCFDCGFEGDFETTETGFKCPECGNQDPETVDVVKRTCGYLGNPVVRPTIEGRHKEISARVKHMERPE
jgi:ribonucleoside-triphosphate reductase